jgi:hypothetical protein
MGQKIFPTVPIITLLRQSRSSNNNNNNNNNNLRHQEAVGYLAALKSLP